VDGKCIFDFKQQIIFLLYMWNNMILLIKCVIDIWINSKCNNYISLYKTPASSFHFSISYSSRNMGLVFTAWKHKDSESKTFSKRFLNKNNVSAYSHGMCLGFGSFSVYKMLASRCMYRRVTDSRKNGLKLHMILLILYHNVKDCIWRDCISVI
jgi:hypothetical protein